MEQGLHPGESREYRADVLVRLLDAAKKIESLHGKSVAEVFGTEESRREFLANLDPEEFIQLLNGINGVLRNKDKEEWQMEQQEVHVEGALLPSEYIPPKPEDKPELFRELAEHARKMATDQRSLEDIALLVGAGINATHAYSDANGRTSRFANVLIKDGYSEDTKENLRKVLGEDGRESLDINPSFIRFELKNKLLYEPLGNPEKNPLDISSIFSDKVSAEYVYKEDVPDELKQAFLQTRTEDSDYFRIAILDCLYKQTDPSKYVETFPKQGPPERKVVVLSKLTPELDKNAIEEILSGYWELKKEYVEMMMDSIANPDKPEYQVEVNGKNTRIIDIFKSKIQK